MLSSPAATAAAVGGVSSPCVLAVLLATLCELSSSLATDSSIPFVQPQSCSHSQFYHISQLRCSPCETNQRRGPDGLRCVCGDGYTTNDTISPVAQCTACSRQAGNVVSLEGRTCLRCKDGDCSSCGENQVREEDLTLKIARCTTCENKTVPNALGNACVPCHETFLLTTDSCICPPGNLRGGLCFRNTQLPPTALTVPDSFWYRRHLHASYLACSNLSYKNQTACQLLTNLVVLNVNSLERSKAFVLYSSIAPSTKHLPKLFYVDSNLAATLGQTAPSGLSFHKDSQIALKIVKYDARGNFLGWEDVIGGTLQLCPGAQHAQDAAYTFGSFYLQSCTVGVSELLGRFPEPVLYELFLQYSDPQGKAKVWPVPVRSLNLDRDGFGAGALRRFFLVDGLTGRKSSLSEPPSSVTYAKELTLRIYLPTSKPSSQPPFLLTVQYAQIDDLSARTQVTFSVTYDMKQSTHKRDTDIAMGVLGSLAIFSAMLETSSWRRRTGLQFIDVSTIMKYFACLAGALSNAFFLVSYITGIYWLIVYKRFETSRRPEKFYIDWEDYYYYRTPDSKTEWKNFQYFCTIVTFRSKGQHSTVEVTLPPAGGQIETDFIIYTSCAFGLKALELIHILIVQMTISIFLIDWEKPKGRQVAKPGGNQPNSLSVSIWRTYFIANEWNEIQTKRKINPLLQLFAVVLLLEVIGLKNIARRDLYLDLTPGPDMALAPWSPILRYGIGVSMWLAVGLVQVVFFVGIYERFVENKIQQFVDLCSVSNVSVLVLQHRCYGYYIHGRSVHGQTDVGLENMYLNLRKEEENLCGMRGLEPNSEVQTFEVLLSSKVRQQYDRILAPLQEVVRVNRGLGGNSVLLQQNLKAYNTMNKFLSSFLDHSYKDMDYTVRDKLFLERILDFEFQPSEDRSFFYNDDRNLFSNALYYGHEFVLLLFDALLFSVMDLGTQNYVLAAIITFVVQKILELIREEVARRNLAVKTLVDKRFLI